MRPVRSTLVELFVKADGTPVAFSPITGIGLQPAPEPEFMVMFASDEEGLFGQQCPKCASYFRSGAPFTSQCPYCGATPDALEFITPTQRRFFKGFAEAIITAPEGETTVDLDQLLSQSPRTSSRRGTTQKSASRRTSSVRSVAASSMYLANMSSARRVRRPRTTRSSSANWLRALRSLRHRRQV